jgi:hypothetical protein
MKYNRNPKKVKNHWSLLASEGVVEVIIKKRQLTLTPRPNLTKDKDTLAP